MRVEDLLKVAGDFYNKEHRVPSVRELEKLGVSRRKLYETFPGGVSELAQRLGAELPEERIAAKKLVESRGVGGAHEEFRKMVGDYELGQDKAALKVVVDEYTDQAKQLGHSGEELVPRLGFLAEVLENVGSPQDLDQCCKLLDELVGGLQLLQAREKLKADVEKALSDIQGWRDHFQGRGVVGKAWLDHAESIELQLVWVVEQAESCGNIEDVSSLEEYLRDIKSESSTLVEGANRRLQAMKKRQLAELALRGEERLFQAAISKFEHVRAASVPPSEREKYTKWFSERVWDPNFPRVFLKAPC